MNEAGLPVIGSAAASDSEIFNGSITPSGGTGPYTFALTGPATRQPRHAAAERRDGTYTYTLTIAVRHDAGQRDNGDADRAGQGQLQLHGDRRPRQQRHRHDPGRHHRRRSDGACGQRQCDRGQLLLAVAASGVLSNDVAGADGFAAGGGVVGVRAAGNDLTTDVTTGVNTPIAGLHGTLVLQANGGYIYQSTANNITADDTDVFVYTVKDGDGDLSTTTLTINLANVTVSATDTDALVNEAGLPDRQRCGIGQRDLQRFDHAVRRHRSVHLYTEQPGDGQPRHAAAERRDGTYTYTLTSPFDTTPDSATTATQTEQNKDSFSYTVTDANGDTATGTILVDIIDDIPTAVADTNSVVEGAIVTGNVLTDGTADVFGADGATTTVPAGGVVGRYGRQRHVCCRYLTGSGPPIGGSFGTLTLNADGSYSYDGNPNVVPPAGATDVFVYTITDGDGDTSTMTLTITLTDTGLAASNDDLTVNETALDTSNAVDPAGR